MRTWVLLRGLTREAGHWGSFIGQLSAQLPGERIVMPDLPGCGRLHRTTCPTDVAAMVPACRAQLRDFGVQGPVCLLALSLGAMVAVAWAQAHARELAGVVLVNTSLRPFSPLHCRLRPSAWPAVLGAGLARDALAREAAILRLTSRSPHPRVLEHWMAIRRARPVSRSNALRQLLAAARFKAPQQSPATPMLVLVGGADRMVDPRCSQSLARRWNLPLDCHPDGGHDLMLDEGDWVAERVAHWAQGLR